MQSIHVAQMKDNRFKIVLPVKSYVRQYLLNNFLDEKSLGGDVINLRKDAELNAVFRNMLSKKSHRYDGRYKDISSRYRQKVWILISRDDFNRYGVDISATDAIRFGRILESRAKSILYSYIDIYRSIGCSIKDTINRFQEIMNYPEEVWSADSIRRDYNRRSITNREFADTLFSQIDKIFVGNLSVNRTISNTYEND